VRKQLFFPDRRLLQYDCGKLQELDVLLRRLKTGGHRVLIFTQVRVKLVGQRRADACVLADYAAVCVAA
jgi:hypothetical protein